MADWLVSAFYKFVRLDDFEALRTPFRAEADRLGIKGLILLAKEGINGTIAGSEKSVLAMLDFMQADNRIRPLDHKESHASRMPFRKMKVKLKREIVTLGVEGVDPTTCVGDYVDPADWNRLISDENTITIDTRNDYELAIGTFKGAVDPKTESFRDFPTWFKNNRDQLKGKKVAMFCTGGIRCEKSTALLKAEGVEDVYHLKGGILKYLEHVPESDSLWQGECFVFDERVSVGHGLQEGPHTLCRGCRMPVGPAERAHPDFEEGICCPHCRHLLTPEKRRRRQERHRQLGNTSQPGNTGS